MVQCIINIILLYFPHNLLCSAAWPAERVTVASASGWWCVGRGRYSGAASPVPVPASVVDWDSHHHNHGAQADHPRPHSSGARPGGAQQI